MARSREWIEDNRRLLLVLPREATGSQPEEKYPGHEEGHDEIDQEESLHGHIVLIGEAN